MTAEALALSQLPDNAGQLIPSKSGLPGYNPLVDAPALRLYQGCRLIGPGRYEVGRGLIVDPNGMFCAPEECPECHSSPGYDLRYFVAHRPNPFAKEWTHEYRPCRRCVGQDELDENEALMDGVKLGQGTKRRRKR